MCIMLCLVGRAAEKHSCEGGGGEKRGNRERINKTLADCIRIASWAKLSVAGTGQSQDRICGLLSS